LYCFFVIGHSRRKVLHFNATEHPTGSWVAQQWREAFPEDTAPRSLILDRDRKYEGEATEVLESLSGEPIRTADQSPWQNGVAERWMGSCRRALLDHVLVVNEGHLRRLVREYLGYYHADRIHDGLGKGTPEKRPVEGRGAGHCQVAAMPRLGGLHHRYTWSAAA
jgi:transposase InsO family protein